MPPSTQNYDVVLGKGLTGLSLSDGSIFFQSACQLASIVKYVLADLDVEVLEFKLFTRTVGESALKIAMPTFGKSALHFLFLRHGQLQMFWEHLEELSSARERCNHCGKALKDQGVS